MTHAFQETHEYIEATGDKHEDGAAKLEARTQEYTEELIEYGYLAIDPECNLAQYATEEVDLSCLQKLIFAIAQNNSRAILDAADIYRLHMIKNGLKKYAHTAADIQINKEAKDALGTPNPKPNAAAIGSYVDCLFLEASS